MSIEIIITQKGFIKKTLPLNVILGESLSYGRFDGLRLEKGVYGGDELIAYNPEHIGRGFSVKWTPKTKNKLQLRILNPTTEHELRDFYDAIKRITSFWNCSLKVDGEITDAETFQTNFQGMVKFNTHSLNYIADQVIDDDSEITLHCAMWPLVFDKEQGELALKDKNSFGIWMHEKQSVDAYFAKPMFFKTDDGILGVYCFTEGLKSIFPIKPYVPFDMVEPGTNHQLECDNYIVFLYSREDDKLGEIQYDAFLSSLQKTKFDQYDANHYILEPHSSQEMKEFIADNT